MLRQDFLLGCCRPTLQETRFVKMAKRCHQAKRCLEMPSQQTHQESLRSALVQLHQDAGALYIAAAPAEWQTHK